MKKYRYYTTIEESIEMSDNDKKDGQGETLTQDQVTKMIADATAKAVAEANEAAAAKIKELNEENKNRRLTVKEIAEALGAKGEDGKTDIEIVKESLTNQNKTIQQLQTELENERKEKTVLSKKAKAEKVAAGYNFIDVDDVIAKLDLAGMDDAAIEAKIKEIAETKKHWIKPVTAGDSFTGRVGESGLTIEEAHKEALAKKDISSAISLKTKMFSKK